MHNVGSIFRTADAAGVEKIYLCGITPAPIDKFGRARRQISKTALGAEKYIEWEYAKSTPLLLNKLKKQGCKILAIEQSKKSVPYYSLEILKQVWDDNKRGKFSKIILVLGNEIRGLPHSVLSRADKILEIPMRGKKESLNVAVAFGIVVFHLLSDK